jgi:hypothetical protein
LAPLPRPWYLGWGAYAAAIGALVAILAGLACLVVIHGPDGVLVGVVDVAMLVATIVWFSIAIARRAPREGVPVRPPNEGSPGGGAGR